MNNKIIFGIGGIVVGVIITLLLSPMMQSGSIMSGQKIGNGNQMIGNIDQHFIEQMIPHHEGAIVMAKLALERSKRPEVLSLANGIIEAQKQEITDMKKWYQDWFGTQVPVTSQGMMSGNSMVHMGSISGDLEVLKNAKYFDQEFINQMIQHHEMAVMMAQMLQGGTNRPEMKQLADNIITSQTKEIEIMRTWAKAWSK